MGIDQVVGQTFRAVQVEVVSQLRVADIHADEQHPFPKECHRDSQIATDKRFSFSAHTRSNENDLLVLFVEYELYVVAYQSEKLGNGAVFAFAYDNMVFAVLVGAYLSEKGQRRKCFKLVSC